MFDPKELINIGTTLRGGNTQAHIRSVINRSYYAAFGHVRKNTPKRFYGISVHQDLIKYYLESDDKEEQKVGKKLELLFKKRKDADYEYNSNIAKGTSEFALREAEDAIKLFDSL